MGAGAQKSGGAAALPAPPPPRSLYMLLTHIDEVVVSGQDDCFFSFALVEIVVNCSLDFSVL